MTVLIVNRMAIEPTELGDTIDDVCREASRQTPGRIIIQVTNWEQSLHSDQPNGLLRLYRCPHPDNPTLGVGLAPGGYRYFAILLEAAHTLLVPILPTLPGEKLFPVWHRLTNHHELAWQPARDFVT